MNPLRDFHKWLPQFRQKRRCGSRKRPLSVERLERRLPLYGRDVLSSEPLELTISFAPEGTDIGGQSSDLHAEFNQISRWQTVIVDAFKTWADLIGAEVRVVTDSGADFGAAGKSTGDSRFGDIRIGATSLNSDAYALSISRFDDVGTWAGDIIFNSDATLGSRAELFAVALHEAGHVLGLDHSANPNSPMYENGIPLATEPTAADRAALEKIYSQMTTISNLDDLLQVARNSRNRQHPGRGNQHRKYELRNSNNVTEKITVAANQDAHDNVSYLLLNTQLSSSQKVASQNFLVTEPSLLVFELTTKILSPSDDTTIVTTITTADGDLVDRFFIEPGSTSENAVLLVPGAYRVQVALIGASSNSEMLAAISLSAESYSHKLGPGVSDPTTDPLDPSWQSYFDEYMVIITDPLIWPWAGML